MKAKEKVKLEGQIEVDKPELCDRCGNDLAKGFWALHFPFAKKYIFLCHICNLGLMYGFWRDISVEIKQYKI